MATHLPSDYNDAPSFIKSGIVNAVLEKHFDLMVRAAGRESGDYETLKLFRKEYRRYRRHWRRLDIRLQKQQHEYRQQILNNHLPW